MTKVTLNAGQLACFHPHKADASANAEDKPRKGGKPYECADPGEEGGEEKTDRKEEEGVLEKAEEVVADGTVDEGGMVCPHAVDAAANAEDKPRK